MYPTLTPAYGRDYRSKKAIAADLAADLDFRFNGGPYVNRSQLVTDGIYNVNVRYGKLRKVAVFDLRKVKA